MRALCCFVVLFLSGYSFAQTPTETPTAEPVSESPATSTETEVKAAEAQTDAKAAPARSLFSAVKEALKAKPATPMAPKPVMGKKKEKLRYGVVLFKKGRLKLTAHLLGTMRAESVDKMVVDAIGSERDLETIFDARGRGGLTLEYRKNKFQNISFEYEHDAWTGPITEPYDGTVEFKHAAHSEIGHHELRKLSVKGRKELLFGGAGYMLSHWGMGLIANDGAHGWRPGSGRIVDPRSGDRVLRAFGGIGPLPGLGLTILGGYDHMIADDVLLDEDDGHQGIIALLIDPRKDNRGGVYAAFRTHEHADGRKTEVTVIDFHLRLRRHPRLHPLPLNPSHPRHLSRARL